MLQFAFEKLRQLSLEGSCQVHVDGTPLLIDPRAHQVLIKPSRDVLTQLARHYSNAQAIFVSSAEQNGLLPTSFAPLLAENSELPEWLIVPANVTGHPRGLYGLVWVVDRLLGPGGCPWDQEQTHKTLKKYLLEEVYELFDAIDGEDNERMLEELGDVLLQPVMHAQMRRLAGDWDIETVAERVTEKLIRRHPHVFNGEKCETANEVLKNWDKIKSDERGDLKTSILEGVPKAMPSLLRAYAVSVRAARVGFEWPCIDSVFDKLREEERELRSAMDEKEKEAIEAELGDLLFTVVNLARWAGIEPEEALHQMVDRFTERFRLVEEMADKPLGELSPEDWDRLWEKAKEKVSLR